MATEVSMPAAGSSPDQTPTRPSAGFRLWPAMVLIGLYWGFLFGYELVELSMFQRFVSRFVALGLFVLGFLIWWLTNRRFSRAERWWTLLAFAVGAAVAALLGDPSAGKFLPLVAAPFVFTAWTLWLVAARGFHPLVRQLGLCLGIWLVLGYFTLIRWDGLDGGQHSVYAWRWEPTAENRFLAAHIPAPSEVPADASALEATVSPTVGAGDWPEFRGPRRDGQLVGLNLASDWKAQAPERLWRQRIGPAWSSVVVVGDRLFTQEQRGESEVVVAYDAAKGNELWIHADPVRFFENLSGAGPRATPTFADGRLLTFGGTGLLNCLDAATGKLIWTHDVVQESGAEIPQWGYSSSPLVTGNVVVTYAGGDKGQGLLAYRADTGDPLWQAPAGKNSYSSPQLATVAGHDQILMLSDTGLSGLDPATGGVLWQLPSTATGPATPVVQPQTVGDGKFLIQSGAGLALVEVTHDGDQWTAREVWKSEALKPSLNDVVVLDGALYGFDDGIFCCVDVETGKRRWKKGRYGHGQVLLVADQRLLLVVSENGEAVLLAANPERHQELTSFSAIEGKTWNHPVVAHGRLYTRNAEEIACYALPSAR